jgi:hypothetical protein
MPSRCGRESALAEDAQQPGMDELMQAIREIEVGQFLLSTLSTLLSLAYGKLEQGELEQAKAAIGAIQALLPALEGQVEAPMVRDLSQALANLQVAYADAAAGTSSAPGE